MRTIKPETVVVIGSGHGFVPMCLAHGLQANDFGAVNIVEPGFYEHKVWENQKIVSDRFRFVGIDRKYIRHHKMTSEEFYKNFPWVIDFLYIDGAIDKKTVEFDFYKVGKRVKKGGYILIHDIDHSETELLEPIYRKNIFEEVKESKDYEHLSIMGGGGLGLVRKLI